jgi:hypothetical protein
LKNDLILEPQRITSTTVKVRRLGYLVSIPSIIQDREIQFEILKRNVFNWAKENHRFFEHYSLELPVARAKRRLLTGEIKTVGAAGRYINTCEELGFITKVRGFRTSKTGKAISGLSRKGNPFHLSLGQIFLTLRSLLEKDYDSLSALVKILGAAESDRIELFRNEVQDRLYRKTQKAQEMNKLYVVDLLRSRIEQIRNWRKPKRYYLENIEAPRIEWMLDLKFIKHWDQRLNSFDTEDHLYDFFKSDIIGDRWLQDEFPIIFADFYEKMLKDRARQWSDLDPEDRLGLLNRLLEEGMVLFKTGAEIGKISASEFFEYSAASLIENQSILVTPISEFEKDLIDYTRTAKLQYRYVQTVSPADKGYIVKL